MQDSVNLPSEEMLHRTLQRVKALKNKLERGVSKRAITGNCGRSLQCPPSEKMFCGGFFAPEDFAVWKITSYDLYSNPVPIPIDITQEAMNALCWLHYISFRELFDAI
jgi:hypothetical protein